MHKFYTKFTLASLFCIMSWSTLLAQNVVTVNGAVTNDNGSPEYGVNILVSAIFADSSGVFLSLYTDSTGMYTVSFETPGPNMFGLLEVSMVDCWGTTVTQYFNIESGGENFVADFVYCEEFPMDSCVVFILEEWNPANELQLTAWNPAGGTGTYLWSTGDTTASIYPQESGTYCVEVNFPSFGCSVTDCIEVNLDSTGNCFAFIVSTDNNDGTYNLQAVPSGAAPFSYLWNTGATTQEIFNVGPGSYCVEVQDASDCAYSTCIFIDSTNFCEVYITEEPNGGLYAEGFGHPPVMYVWDTGDSTQTIFPQEPGIYCVTMYDANGCIATSCYDYGWSQDSCFVYVNAFLLDSNTLALAAIGFSAADTLFFEWSTGETTDIIYPTDPSQTYCVTMTDSDGCSSSACFDSNNWCYAWIDLQYVDTSIAILTVQIDPIFMLPGSPEPTYLWSNGHTTPVLTVIESGEYCVTVSMGNNCVTESCVTVDFEGLGNECSVWVVQYPDSSGTWTVEAFAWGVGTFEYLWSNGDTNQVTTTLYPTDYNCVTVTSSFGCQAVACTDSLMLNCEAIISVNYFGADSALLVATVWGDSSNQTTLLWNTGETGYSIVVDSAGTYCVIVTTPNCTYTTCIDVDFSNNGQCGVWISDDFHPFGVAYTANGWGTPPFTYLWSNGDTNQTTIIDFGIHDLCVTITDANGCTSSGCNFPVDSCNVSLYFSYFPTNSIHISSTDPIAQVFWSTGDSTHWIAITEPGEYCATVTSIFGCESYTCITIDSIPGDLPNAIEGVVFGDTLSSLKGYVMVFAYNPNQGNAFKLIDSTQIGPNGAYKLTGVPDGVYVIKAVMSSGTQESLDYLPTYHYSSTRWEQADPIVLPSGSVSRDIFMIPTTGISGGGVIGGFVTDGQHIVAGGGAEERDGLAGLPNVEVLLKDAQGQPLNYAWTLEEGNYRFTGLPWGTYRISYDIPGLTSPEIWVTLSKENPERLQVNLIVEGGTVAVDDVEAEKVLLYPNPAYDEINVVVPNNSANLNMQLIDMQGRIIHAGSVKHTNGIITINIAALPGGLYHLNLQDKNANYYGRFVKQE